MTQEEFNQMLAIGLGQIGIGDAGANVENPDEIYASIVFDKNRHKTDGIELLYPNAIVERGGAGTICISPFQKRLIS